MYGVIHKMVEDRGFGFIRGEDGRDYFFHIRSFNQKSDADKLVVGAAVTFIPGTSLKGLKATHCALDDLRRVKTVVVPEMVLLSKTDHVPGWEIMELGQREICGSSSDSPDDAKKSLIARAMYFGATALLNVEYYKSTGASGNYRFTIHNYRANMALIARPDRAGWMIRADIRGLNQRIIEDRDAMKAAAIRYMEKQAREERKRNKVFIAINLGILAVALAMGLPWFASALLITVPACLIVRRGRKLAAAIDAFVRHLESN